MNILLPRNCDYYLMWCGESNKMAQSGSLSPCSHALLPHVSSQTVTLEGYVTAQITYSTEHTHHKVLAWSWATVYGMPVWRSPWKPWLLLHWCYICVTSWLCYMSLCYGFVMITLWFMLRLLLWLLHQSGERLCYGCGASQEKINMSAVPMPLGVSFQPLSLCLAYLGFNKQCRQCEQ